MTAIHIVVSDIICLSSALAPTVSLWNLRIVFHPWDLDAHTNSTAQALSVVVVTGMVQLLLPKSPEAISHVLPFALFLISACFCCIFGQNASECFCSDWNSLAASWPGSQLIRTEVLIICAC